MSKQPPEWVINGIKDLVNVFGLGAWEIGVKAVKHPGGKGQPAAAGSAAFIPDYLTAVIRVHRDITPNDDGVETVTHEVLHLVLNEVRDLFADTAGLLPEDQRGAVMERYNRVEERAITVIARGLTRHFDFSERWTNGRTETRHEIAAGDPAVVPDAIGGRGSASGPVAGNGKTSLENGAS